MCVNFLFVQLFSLLVISSLFPNHSCFLLTVLGFQLDGNNKEMLNDVFAC